MECETCDKLLATYKREVTLFKNVVRDFPGKVEDDFRLAIAEVDRLKLECREASNSLMEHWREHHGAGAKPGS